MLLGIPVSFKPIKGVEVEQKTTEGNELPES